MNGKCEIKDEKKNISIVIATKSPYNVNEIIAKADEYNWDRTKRLAFLILQKLHNVKYNEQYDYTDIGDVEKFKRELNELVKKFKEITKNMFEKNEWPSASDPVSSKIVDMIEKLNDFCKNDEMKSTYMNLGITKDSEKDTENVLRLLCTIDQDEMFCLEYDILAASGSGGNFKLLYEVYGLNKYYAEIFAQKNLLLVSYCNLSKYLTKLSLADIFCQDWSKFLVDTALGYTYKYIHANGDPNNIIKSWEEFSGKDLTDFFNTTFEISSRIHYKMEDYIPEHYATTKSEEYRDNDQLKISNKENMGDTALQKSFLDMCGRLLTELLESNTEDLKHANYVEIVPKFFDRYNPTDAIKMIDLILSILKDKSVDSKHYEEKARVYNDYKKSSNIEKK